MRLVDADALMKTVFNDVVLVDGEVKGVGLILAETVDSAPSIDAVAVVRCKGCKHYDLGICLKIYQDGNAHTEAWQPRKPEDFCSYGERKGKNETERT